MKKEYTLVFIVGLFLLSYVLEAIVNPLTVDLATPYHFIQPNFLTTYPFTTATIIIRSLGMFIAPIWLMSFFESHYLAKSAILLVLAALMQLYALQEVATGARLVPLEWSLSLSLAGVVLLIPMVFYLIIGSISSAHQKISGRSDEEEFFEDEEDEENEDEDDSESEEEE